MAIWLHFLIKSVAGLQKDCCPRALLHWYPIPQTNRPNQAATIVSMTIPNSNQNVELTAKSPKSADNKEGKSKSIEETERGVVSIGPSREIAG